MRNANPLQFWGSLAAFLQVQTKPACFLFRRYPTGPSYALLFIAVATLVAKPVSPNLSFSAE